MKHIICMKIVGVFCVNLLPFVGVCVCGQQGCEYPQLELIWLTKPLHAWSGIRPITLLLGDFGPKLCSRSMLQNYI